MMRSRGWVTSGQSSGLAAHDRRARSRSAGEPLRPAPRSSRAAAPSRSTSPARPGREADARRQAGQDGPDLQRRLARRRDLPQPQAGRRLPRRDGGGQEVQAGDRALQPLGPAEHEHLQPEDPGLGLRLPDHARRDQARDRRPPAGRGDPGGGPFPTLFEYAGYGYADPFNGPDSGIAQIANLLGFAVVDVNMRGTGCSGGAYDYFEPLQGLDGYDVIETVARQPWVLHHKVGMMGVSYGGISQLFVAETQPPSLAAIAPLSVIDDSTTTLYAGGILNTGFTVPWIKDRVNDALPATATTGQSWALKQITEARRDVQGQPGTAPVGRQPAGQGRPQPLLRAEGRRPAVADHVRAQDQRAGVPGLPVHRRADRRALPGHRVALHRAPRTSGSRSPTASTPTPSIR